MEDIVDSIYLPIESTELLLCDVNWGPVSRGLRLNRRLKRLVCLDCGVCVGKGNNLTFLKMSIRRHRVHAKHDWPNNAVDDFLSPVVTDLLLDWDEPGVPDQDTVHSAFEGLKVYDCFSCRDENCSAMFQRKRATSLHMRSEHID